MTFNIENELGKNDVKTKRKIIAWLDVLSEILYNIEYGNAHSEINSQMQKFDN
jgi:hypothetical protein